MDDSITERCARRIVKHWQESRALRPSRLIRRIAEALRSYHAEGVREERERIRALVGAHIAQWEEYPDGATVLDMLPFLGQQEGLDQR